MSSFVAVINHSNVDELECLASLAYNDYNCLGVEAVNLQEQEIEDLWPGETGPFVLHQLPEDANAKLLAQIQPQKFYFASQSELDQFISATQEFGFLSVEQAKVEDQDWNSEWKKHYHSIVVSDDLRVIPAWSSDIQKQDLLIYPGQGFGTGSHETTYLCLKLLTDHLNDFKRESRVLDFGCGSGILALATKKLLNAETRYCDIDASALENTRQNITLNGFLVNEDEIVLRSNFTHTPAYHLVFANILLSALIEENHVIKGSVAPNGYLMLSGLLNQQVQDALANYTDEFDVVTLASKNDWSAILLQKK